MGKVPKEVYEILNIEEENSDNPWEGGMKVLENVTYEKVERIGNILGDTFLQSRINDSPTIEEFLIQFKDSKEFTHFNGSIRSPKRDDESVSFDIVVTKRTKENIEFIKESYVDMMYNIGDDLVFAYWD